MMKIAFLVLIVCILSSNTKAQSYYKVNGGFGFGLDYGGVIGTKLTYLPIKWLGLFGSVGLYYYYAGYSTGVQFKLPSKKRMSGYLTGMYGVNGEMETEVIITAKQYNGTTIGAGLELKNKKRNTFWNLNLLVPFRDDQLKKDVADFESQGLSVFSTTWPVNFSIGFHANIH